MSRHRRRRRHAVVVELWWTQRVLDRLRGLYSLLFTLLFNLPPLRLFTGEPVPRGRAVAVGQQPTSHHDHPVGRSGPGRAHDGAMDQLVYEELHSH